MTININQYINNIIAEDDKVKRLLHLTANENRMSDTAKMFMGSRLNERYYMGAGKNDIVDMGTFTYLGFEKVEELVNTAKEAAKEMLGAAEVNFNVLSGIHAMMSAILSTTEPGDLVLTVPLKYGGHFATEGIINRVGRKHGWLDYDLANLKFDAEKIGQKVKELGAKALYFDVSFYVNPHNITEIRAAVGDEVIIIYDASHTMGLIMGQQFQAPLKEGANVICANTHKTLPGPHKGMIAFRDKELGEKANAIIDNCLFSTNHMTHIIALSITILEMKEFGVEYAKQIIANSNAIAEEFVKLGYKVRKSNNGKYSNNHQIHVYVDKKDNYYEVAKKLISNDISTNFENEALETDDSWYFRIGTQEITRRGMKENEMIEIANLVNRAIKDENVIADVAALNQRFTKVLFSFDK